MSVRCWMRIWGVRRESFGGEGVDRSRIRLVVGSPTGCPALIRGPFQRDGLSVKSFALNSFAVTFSFKSSLSMIGSSPCKISSLTTAST